MSIQSLVLVDSTTHRLLRMIEQRDPNIERARTLMKQGMTGKAICKELGWYYMMVSRLKALDDPKSGVNRRLTEYRKEKQQRARNRQQRQEAQRVQRETRAGLTEMRRAEVGEGMKYDQFLARERGEPVPGRRIPLLDYSEDDEQATDQHRKRAWRGEFRRISRRELPVEDRVKILVGLARSDDPAVAMKALHELHSIEGAIKKPTPEVKTGGGPLFTITGGLPVQVAPVTAVDLPTREDDSKPA